MEQNKAEVKQEKAKKQPIEWVYDAKDFRPGDGIIAEKSGRVAVVVYAPAELGFNSYDISILYIGEHNVRPFNPGFIRRKLSKRQMNFILKRLQEEETKMDESNNVFAMNWINARVKEIILEMEKENMG